MATLEQLKSAQKELGKCYTNVEFILNFYKTSTLPRLFYWFNASVVDLDNNKVLTKYLKSRQALKDGFSQDALFDILFPENN
jgi:hypothetical protein